MTTAGKTAGPATRRQGAPRPRPHGTADERARVRRPAAGAPPAPAGRGAPAVGLEDPRGVTAPVWERVLGGVRVGPAWMLAPLRLFLGVTFVYAGFQKLSDPQYFAASAPRFIGRQIQAFAHGSPIGGLLVHAALPHAALFGALIAYGEIAIGLGTLAGFLARPAAFFGGLLSLIFFLSASWNVHPYFYGADIVFLVAWISLGLAPHAGLPSLDAELAQRLRTRARWDTPGPRLVLALALSTSSLPAKAPAAGTRDAVRLGATRGASARRAGRAYHRQSRRSFLTGLATGAAGLAGLAWLWGLLRPRPDTPPPSLPSGGAPAAGSTATGTTVIANVRDVPTNSAATFSIPSTGDPGVVVHLQSGQFVAFDATCTHAGCPVQYDPGSGDLFCPCHGAVFDPARQAAVLQGPADTPLAPVTVRVASNGDIVLADS